MDSAGPRQKMDLEILISAPLRGETILRESTRILDASLFWRQRRRKQVRDKFDRRGIEGLQNVAWGGHCSLVTTMLLCEWN